MTVQGLPTLPKIIRNDEDWKVNFQSLSYLTKFILETPKISTGVCRIWKGFKEEWPPEFIPFFDEQLLQHLLSIRDLPTRTYKEGQYSNTP